MVVFDGLVKDLPAEVRQDLLEQSGTLIPEPKEFDFVVGHEAGHLLNNDHRNTTIVGIVSAVGAHLSIKTWNWMLYKLRRERLLGLRPVKNVLSHCLLVGTTVVLVVGITGWNQEKNADVLSATKLELEREAWQLAEKQVMQNKLHKEASGDPFITSSGNDITEVKHPPKTFQRNYLKRLAESKEDRNR